MKIIGVIPARYASSRFPGKPLVKLLGIPMIIHVARIVEKALGKYNTFIATDDERIKKIVESFGFTAVMTSNSCLTGTDRIWDFAKKVPADIYVNIQGDEPLLDPLDIKKIVQAKKNNFSHVVNGMTDLGPSESPENVNIPKVVVSQKNELIYISRLPIPGIKSTRFGQPAYKKQVCIYAFNFEELEAFGTQKEKAIYENHEDIEILRFFDLGIPIKMVKTSASSLAIDVPQDIEGVEKKLKKQNNENHPLGF